jgi:hypothetical protein
VEYEALGRDFTDRGKRIEEQVALMRRLWTEEVVTHDGPSEKVTAAGLAPLPVQRPIPIWFGAASEPAWRRVGRLADGWFPQAPPGPKLDDATANVHEAARAAGRDPATLGVEGRVSWGSGGPDAVGAAVEAWRAIGATHVSVNTMGVGLGGVDGHLDALAQVAAAVGLR